MVSVTSKPCAACMHMRFDRPGRQLLRWLHINPGRRLPRQVEVRQPLTVRNGERLKCSSNQQRGEAAVRAVNVLGASCSPQSTMKATTVAVLGLLLVFSAILPEVHAGSSSGSRPSRPSARKPSQSFDSSTSTSAVVRSYCVLNVDCQTHVPALRCHTHPHGTFIRIYVCL